MMRVRRCVLLTLAVVTWTAAPAQAQWMIAPYLGMNLSGDVEQGKGGAGGSAGYLGGRVGFEFDIMRYQHFFKIPRCSRSILPRHPTAYQESQVPAQISIPTP